MTHFLVLNYFNISLHKQAASSACYSQTGVHVATQRAARWLAEEQQRDTVRRPSVRMQADIQYLRRVDRPGQLQASWGNYSRMEARQSW